MTPDRPNHAPTIKRALADPTRVLESLGILGEGKQRQRQASGWLILCPVHQEKSPSCSVQLRGDSILWKCHGCQASGDVLDLVAAVRGLNMSRDFPQVLIGAARLAGLWTVVAELEGRGPVVAPMAAPEPRVHHDEPERVYPPSAEVEALWAIGEPASNHETVRRYLRSRAIDPEKVAVSDLARAIASSGALPRWARYQGRSWRDTGHLLVLPMFDAAGGLTSVRAWRVIRADIPKRLPPAGHKASGLVMADAFALAWLRGTRAPETIVIVEGEPNFLSRCLVNKDPHAAVLGIVSGSWSEAFAAKVPVGSRVILRTDDDDAGDRYANEIAETIKRRAFIWRTEAA
jgi:hypothetical protein